MKFIAEIGWNFLGDINLAKEMITAAKDAGADYAKFQVWDPEYLKPGPWDHDGRREIYQKACLDDKRLREISDCCRQLGVRFFASVFERKSLHRLSAISTDIVKIPSHECVNIELIDDALAAFDTVILSIGALSESQLMDLIARYGHSENLHVLHCVSSYPLEAHAVNLPKMLFLKQHFKSVGYSSHFTGIVDAVLASALGATYVEKHFTTDNELPGRDNKFALLPSDFEKMVVDSRTAQQAMTDLGLGIQDCEIDVAEVMRGRWSK